MSITAQVVLLYSLLFAVVLIAMASSRSYLILIKGRPVNAFKPDGTDVAPFLYRLTRVHANLTESLPLLLPLLVALLTQQESITDPLAMFFIAARFAQAMIHLASTSEIAVKIRFAFFVVQLVLSMYWGVLLLLL